MSRVSSRKDFSTQGTHFIKDKEKEKILTLKATLDESNTDAELFNFWRQMHMTNGTNGTIKESIATPQHGSAAGLIVSRKRKAWEEGPQSGNKYIGSGRLPPARGSEDEEERGGLDTPNCSRTGFEDEENGEESSGDQDIVSENGSKSILSPMNPHLLNVEDIDADNLAADFDGSFTGLGVDINTASYSMSEAMLSLNNIALNNHPLKQENSGSRMSPNKSQDHYMFSNYGALDLSNDEAQHPDHADHTQASQPVGNGPQTFSGSVSRDNSQDSVQNKMLLDRAANKPTAVLETKTKSEITSPAHHYSVPVNVHKSLLVYGQGEMEPELLGPEEQDFLPPKLEHFCSVQTSEEDTDARFQYILTAPTSIATKVGEPSLTYINQGQSYELKIKKLGDLSGHYKKKWLRSTIRICFHERRLQYIENEQINEWARTHPNERILEVDLPLSYGIAEVKQDPASLSTVAFSWDPTRESGVFIKVHCISTEFTPKKHGGERGVPFRLQVETWNADARIHAGACILQVFKLKGADRKHKQDREKVQKRTVVEQEKFCPQYECTVLTDLSVDSIYMPPSRVISPVQSDGEGSTCGGKMVGLPNAAAIKSASVPPMSDREESPMYRSGSWAVKSPVTESKSWKVVLPNNASTETTAGWLSFNRYSQHVKTFLNFDSRDLLRLSKDDLIQMIGMLDGIRLFNDLHMKPVEPRLIIYIAQKGDPVFHPFLLEEVTVLELIKLIAETFEIPEALLSKIIVTGPNKLMVKMTDEYLRYQAHDSAFHFNIVYNENGDSCTVHLEPVPYN